MITRTRALARTPRHPACLACVLVPWAAAIAYNAWERRGEILAWLKAQT